MKDQAADDADDKAYDKKPIKENKSKEVHFYMDDESESNFDNTLTHRDSMNERRASAKSKHSNANIDLQIGGDAALMHLLNQIDNGIRYRKNKMMTGRALMFKFWYNFFEPLRYLTLFWYMLHTQFERPAWCIRK